MLAVEVKDIDCQPNSVEERIILDMLRKRAVIVKENMVGNLAIDTKCSLDKLLQNNYMKRYAHKTI